MYQNKIQMTFSKRYKQHSYSVCYYQLPPFVQSLLCHKNVLGTPMSLSVQDQQSHNKQHYSTYRWGTQLV